MCNVSLITTKRNLEYHLLRLELSKMLLKHLREELADLIQIAAEFENEGINTIESEFNSFLIHRKRKEEFDALIDIENEKALIKHFEVQVAIEDNLKKISN